MREREYRHLGTTIDFYVSFPGLLFGKHEVYAELKRKLDRKGELDRLVGQIEGLKRVGAKVSYGVFDDRWAGDGAPPRPPQEQLCLCKSSQAFS